MIGELWVEKYRPKTLDEYAWRDEGLRQKVEEWLREGTVPHLLFSGVQGTGKTSLVKLILALLNVQPADILEINASRERNLDTVREKIMNFVQTWAWGDMKYVLLEEADHMNPMAQAALRSEMERYSDAVRFILTCNYPNKIIPALHSRLQNFHFQALDRGEFLRRALEIAVAEGVDLEGDGVETVDALVEQTYPDLRKCINLMQQSVIKSNGAKFGFKASSAEIGVKDYLLQMADLFRAGRYLEARKLVVAQAPPEDYNDIYRFLYKNLSLWGESDDEQDDAVLIIRKGLVNHTLCADAELNLAGTMIELCRLRKDKK